MTKKPYSADQLEHIWHQVPPDYYQTGVQKNILQKVWHTGKLQTIITAIHSSHPTPEKILDLGCASGWFLSKIKKEFPNSRCYGIDSYKAAIAYGKKNYPKLTLSTADGHQLPFEKNSFDVVICAEVLEHVVDPEKVLEEIKRVLTLDGVAIVEMDTGNRLFQFVWYFWTNLRNGVWKDAHIQHFTAKKLELLIKKNGFTITGKKVFNFTMAVCFAIQKTEKAQGKNGSAKTRKSAVHPKIVMGKSNGKVGKNRVVS